MRSAKWSEVVALGTRAGAAHAAELGLDGHDVDQPGTGAELVKANALGPSLFAAAEHVAVEADGALGVGDPQHHVVDSFNLESHGGLLVIAR